MATNPATAEAMIALVRKQRTFTHEIEGRVFTLTVPTDHQMQVAYLRAGGKQDPASWIVMARCLLQAAIHDWRSVTDEDIQAGIEKTEVAFHADLVPLLLDAQPGWTAELSDEMTKRVALKRQEISHGN